MVMVLPAADAAPPPDVAGIASLPLFPLAGALLLPRGSLPLHIFEPRYLAMVEDAMLGNRMIGMVQPRDEAEPPSLYSVGCAGQITAHTQSHDGRRFITLNGISRFTIAKELPPVRGYRRAEVRWDRFTGDLKEESAAGVQDPKLLHSLRTYFSSHAYDADWNALSEMPAAALVNLLAMMCPFEPREKQALLEAGTLPERAQVLTALLALDSASTVPAGTRVQ
jgi:Lon protease-like protein